MLNSIFLSTHPKFLLRVSVATVALAALAACSGGPETTVANVDNFAVAEDYDLKPEAERNPAPSFELTDQNGDPVTMDDLKGQVVLLNFWATWCGPCREEMPWFAEFEQTYKDRGFSAIGVSLDNEGWEKVTPYLEDHDSLNYRMVIGTEIMAQTYGGIASLPTTFIIDKEGRIAAVHTGLPAGGRPTYEQEIEDLL